MRRKARASAMPAQLARFRADDWLGGPLTDEERNTFGSTAGTAEGMVGVALSRWLWARWEWTDQAGLPGAIEYSVEWLQGPPLARRPAGRGG